MEKLNCKKFEDIYYAHPLAQQGEDSIWHGAVFYTSVPFTRKKLNREKLCAVFSLMCM